MSYSSSNNGDTDWYFLSGTYCQQREVEAITEDVESDKGRMSRAEIL